MSAINAVEPVPQRRARIQNAEPRGLGYSLPYKSRAESLEVKRVASSALIYRVANMRTSVKQRESIALRSLSSDFFSAGQENLETQQLQHAILVELSRDNLADIYTELSKTAEQTEPLLITESGVVVNGNRRLAAMRELFHSDPSRYASFSHIDVAVLSSDADEDTLSEIETILQIRPDLRSDYGWIEEALGLRSQIQDRHWTLDKAAAVWGATPAELEERLRNLLVAEQYLEYLGRPGDYGLVSDDKQAIETFSKAQNARSVTSSASRKEFHRSVMFAILKEDVQDRKHNYAREIEPICREIERRIDLPLVVTSVEVDPDDPFADVPPNSDDVGDALLAMSQDPSYSEEIAQLAESALLDLRNRRSAEKKGRQLLQATTDALAKLAGLSLANTDEMTYLVSLKKIISIQCECARLMSLILSEKPELAREIDLGERNPLREVLSAVNELNRLAS